MKKALIIFTRVPEPGRAKTRLSVRLSDKECAGMQEAMLKDLRELSGVEEWDTFVYYTPAGGEEKIRRLLPGAYAYRPQDDAEFGTRMSGCIGRVLEEGYEACVLIGTDIPVIDRVLIHRAFQVLEREQAVIAPTRDGGYYLIGMKELHREIFEDQVYGKGSVFLDTVEKMKRFGCTYDELPVLIDIDEPEDIEAYRTEYSDRRRSMACTWDYIRKLHDKYGV